MLVFTECEVKMMRDPNKTESSVILRPASREEAGLFYSDGDQDAVLGTVDHVTRQREQLVGRVTYANGDQQEFTDPQEYLRTIQEELPYRNTTGFRHETLTDDPAVREAADDILWDFAGEENPHRTNREITFGGLGK